MILQIAIVFIVWYLIGILGFIYWWCKDYDLTKDEIYLLLLSGFIGIYSWKVGYDIKKEEEIRDEEALDKYTKEQYQKDLERSNNN